MSCSQTELAARHLQRLWDREATAAAELCGVDVDTYAILLELQHRDITPEDYDVLQQLDSNTKRRTLSQHRLDEKVRISLGPPAQCSSVVYRILTRCCTVVVERGQYPAWQVGSRAEAALEHQRARRNLLGELNGCQQTGVATESVSCKGACAQGFDIEACIGHGFSGQSSHTSTNASAGLHDQHCAICLEQFSPNQCVRMLPCLHIFHVHCIDTWLTVSSDTCPECGQPVC